MSEKNFTISPGQVLLFSYLLTIAVGTFLLALPQSRFVDIPLIDLFFTSASCSCVTGLKTVPLSYFTTFGKAVIICLVQLGGLGLMTLSLFFISLFLNLGMATRVMVGKMYEFKWSKIRAFILTVVGLTFAIEILAALYFYTQFVKILPAKKAVFYALFHSISAFCNTGLSLFEGGLIPFRQNTLFLFVIALLVFSGSIGFVVWFELANKIRLLFKKDKSSHTFSLHTKIVLTTTGLIILAGTVLTWLLERSNTLKTFSFADGFFLSFFNSISLRSAGFEIFKIGNLMPATLLLFMAMMYIGSSPGSIGGGIKTTTFALFVATMASFIKNRDEVELFGRRIPRDLIYRSISIIVLSISWILLCSFALLVFESEITFIQVFLEVVSAFSLCGLQTGTCAGFTVIGKILIIVTMLLGRIGALTLVFALWTRKKKLMYRYPEERVVIG